MTICYLSDVARKINCSMKTNERDPVSRLSDAGVPTFCLLVISYFVSDSADVSSDDLQLGHFACTVMHHAAA